MNERVNCFSSVHRHGIVQMNKVFFRKVTNETMSFSKALSLKMHAQLNFYNHDNSRSSCLMPQSTFRKKVEVCSLGLMHDLI